MEHEKKCFIQNSKCVVACLSIDRSLQVKSFSPDVETHVKEIFNDQFEECVFCATITSMVRKEGKVIVVQRIWLAQFELSRQKFKREGTVS